MAIVAQGLGHPTGILTTGGYGLTTPAAAPGDGIDLAVHDTGHLAIIRDTGHHAAAYDHGHGATLRDLGHTTLVHDTGHRATDRDTGHTTTARQPWQS